MNATMISGSQPPAADARLVITRSLAMVACGLRLGAIDPQAARQALDRLWLSYGIDAETQKRVLAHPTLLQSVRQEIEARGGDLHLAQQMGYLDPAC